MQELLISLLYNVGQERYVPKPVPLGDGTKPDFGCKLQTAKWVPIA